MEYVTLEYGEWTTILITEPKYLREESALQAFLERPENKELLRVGGQATSSRGWEIKTSALTQVKALLEETRPFIEEEKPKKKQKTKAITCVGNPVDGFTYYGPFDGASEANEWADNSQELRNLDWWVFNLTSP